MGRKKILYHKIKEQNRQCTALSILPFPYYQISIKFIYISNKYPISSALSPASRSFLPLPHCTSSHELLFPAVIQKIRDRVRCMCLHTDGRGVIRKDQHPVILAGSVQRLLYRAKHDLASRYSMALSSFHTAWCPISSEPPDMDIAKSYPSFSSASTAALASGLYAGLRLRPLRLCCTYPYPTAIPFNRSTADIAAPFLYFSSRKTGLFLWRPQNHRLFAGFRLFSFSPHSEMMDQIS